MTSTLQTFKRSTTEFMKKIKKDLIQEGGNKILHEVRYKTVSKMTNKPKCQIKPYSIVKGKYKDSINGKGKTITKSWQRYNRTKEKAKSKAYQAIEKAVETAVEAIKNAVEKTKTTIQNEIKLADEAANAAISDENVTIDAIADAVIRKIQNVDEDLKDEREKIAQAVQKHVQLAALSIKKPFITHIEVAEILKEAVGWAVAEVTANAESSKVLGLLREVTKLYYKAENNDTNDGPWVAVKCFEGFLYLNYFSWLEYPINDTVHYVKTRYSSKEVLGTMISILEEAKSITESHYNADNIRGRQEVVSKLIKSILILKNLEGSMHNIEKVFMINENKDMQLDGICLDKISCRMKQFMPVFVAGMGNLRRIVEDVEKRNKKKEEITSLQLDWFLDCLYRLCETIKSLVLLYYSKEITKDGELV